MVKKFKTRTEVASIIGIPRRTFSSYSTGQRPIVNPDTRRKLFDLTGIESFRSEKPDKQESILLKEWVNSFVEKPLPNKDKDLDDSVSDDNIGNNNIDEDNKKENIIEDSRTTEINGSLNNGNRPFLDMASELRNWFNNQTQWDTKQEFADRIGVPRSTMKKIFLGFREPKEEYRKKLYEITKLECFKDVKMTDQTSTKTELVEVEKPIGQIEQTVIVQDEQTIVQDLQHVDKLDNLKENITKINSDVEVEKLAKIFYSLARALEPFKHGTPEQRKRIRNKIPPQDLGYVMSFLKAMYDEDSFTDFMFFSEYKLKGGDGDKND